MDVYSRPPCTCCSGSQEPAILHNLLSKQGAPPAGFTPSHAAHHSPHRSPLPPRLSPVFPVKDRLLPTPRTNSMMREGSTGVPSPYSSTGSPSPPTPEASPGPNVSPVPDTDCSRISPYSSTQSKLYQFLTGQRHPSQPSIPHPSPWQRGRPMMPPFQNGLLYNPMVASPPSASVQQEDTRSHVRPASSTDSQTDNQMYANEQLYANERVSPVSPKASTKRPLENDDEPMDLTVKKCKVDNNIDSQSIMSTSILMNILCGQRRSQQLGAMERADTPCSDDIPASNSQTKAMGSNTRVVLAKKNLFPVRARISDWLLKILQFVKSLPEFEQLPHTDKITLLLNSWVKLLLIYMAETNFEFAVTPASNEGNSGSEETTFQEVPTMKSVEIIQGFIKKCQAMSLDEQEFDFLKKSAIFQNGTSGLTVPAYVDHINSMVRQSLQDHIRLARKNESRRYSQVLMCLPTLCGINSQMVRNLFCKHLEGQNDVELLLKEGLQAL